MTDETRVGGRRSVTVVWRWHIMAAGLVVVATAGLVVAGEAAPAAVLGTISAQVVLHGVLAERGRRRQQKQLSRLARALDVLTAADRSGRTATSQRLVTLRTEVEDALAQAEARVLRRLDLHSDDLRDEVRRVREDRDAASSARAVRRRDVLRREAVTASTSRTEGPAW